MRKKIAIVIPSLRGGGAEKVMVNIVKKLDKSRFDIKLVLIKKEGPYVNLIPNDIAIVDLNSERVRYSVFKLVRELNKFKPDVVLSTLGHLNLVLIAIRPLLKINPKIIVREANTPSKNMSELTKKKRIIFTYLYKYLYPKADYIIAQCKEMKKDIIHSFSIDERKIRYIYNPLDIQKIIDNREDKNPYRSNEKNLISVGRLTYQKGFDILIDAFKIINEKFPSTHLTILGDGDLKEELKNKAKKLNISGKISFISFKENPYPYYYYADTYILSSRWEGFPNTLLEALACGTKVVATDCKSGPREILGNSEYGILVKEGDHLSLAEGISKSISEEKKKINRADYFKIDNIIKEYEEIFLS